VNGLDGNQSFGLVFSFIWIGLHGLNSYGSLLWFGLLEFNGLDSLDWFGLN
jgi:hypothetical protein